MRLHTFIDLAKNHRIESMREVAAGLKSGLERIAQFDFGDITVVPIDELSELMRYSHELFTHGLFRLPYGEVSYSFRYGGMDFIVISTILSANKIDYAIIGILNGVPLCDVYGEIRAGKDGIFLIDGDAIDETYEKIFKELDKKVDHLREMAGCSIPALTAMLNAKGIELRRTEPSKKLNASRAKKGRTPISTITEVFININGRKYAASGQATGSHASPRLHWRRGHVRRLSSGEITNVRPCLVGSTHGESIKMPSYKVTKGAA